MDGSQGLLEKLSRLGIHMLPQVGSAIGSFGGPAGAAGGQLVGSGLEALLTPQQSPYGGMGMPVGQGMPFEQEQQGLAAQLAPLAAQGLGKAAVSGMAGAAGLPGAELGMPSDEWIKLLQQVMQSVPKEDLLRWLSERRGAALEGEV